MKKIALFLLLLIGLNGCTFYRKIPLAFPDGFTLQVRVADTYKKQERGWLGQKNTPQKGVLFVFLREEEQAYWNKNMLLDLDVIFLDNNRRITAVYTHIPRREKYTLNAEIPFAFAQAKYLLEVPAGTVETHALQVGDILEFKEQV